MKKALLVISLTLIFSPCFADRQTVSAPIMQAQAFKGQIEQILLPETDSRHEMLVINDQGKEMLFILTPGIGVYGREWEVLSIKKIKAGDKVLVEYTTNKRGDINKAISITVMQP